MTWCKYVIPEECFSKVEKHYYLVKLKTGGIIKANRINGHWFGMWRWLHDDEIEAWEALI